MRCLVLILCFCALLPWSERASAQIKINEIMSSNSSDTTDKEGESADWIELYNESDTAVELGNWAITDDQDDLLQWVFPDISIGPKQFVLLFASGKNWKDSSELHTNFKISKSGEYIGLTNSSGQLIDELQAIEIPTDVSYGRFPDGSNQLVFFTNTTPRASNNPPLEIISVAADLPSGAYDEPQSVSLFSSNSVVEIRYETNGDEPTAKSRLYTSPIKVAERQLEENRISDIPSTPLVGPENSPLPLFVWQQPEKQYKGTMLRYAAFKKDTLVSPIYTRSYFIDPQFAARYSYPVLCISTDSLHLFDFEKGIYVPGIEWKKDSLQWWPRGNYHLKGEEWERPASFTYFDKQGEVQWEADAGLRIRGNGSAAMPQKSFNVFFKNRYGQSELDYPLFDYGNTTTFKRFILRNSGGDFNKTHFRDVCLQSLLIPLDIDIQRFQPVITFINGEYWGIYNLRDKYDKYYIANAYDVDPEEVNILNVCGVVDDGDNADYLSLMHYIKASDMSTKVAYDYVAERVDIDNFIDYQIAEIYFANYDWPCNNKKLWKTNEKGSKWRFLIYDLDFSFGDDLSKPTLNSLEHATSTENTWPFCECSSSMFRGLLQNDSFQKKFVDRFVMHLKTTFEKEHVLQRIVTFKTLYEPEMQEHINRWFYPSNLSSWDYHINFMREFAAQRPCEMEQHLLDFFDLENLAFDCTQRYTGSQVVPFYVSSNVIESGDIEVQNDVFVESTGYKLLNLNGQVVQSGTIDKVPYTIATAGLANGMYILFLDSHQKQEQIKLLLLKR